MVFQTLMLRTVLASKCFGLYQRSLLIIILPGTLTNSTNLDETVALVDGAYKGHSEIESDGEDDEDGGVSL